MKTKVSENMVKEVMGLVNACQATEPKMPEHIRERLQAKPNRKPIPSIQSWICGANSPQVNFWQYAKSNPGLDGTRGRDGIKVAPQLMINHLLKRIEDLETFLWSVTDSGFCRCCACGVAMHSGVEVRWNKNQHYCPDCTIRLVAEYQSDEGLSDEQINDLAQAPFARKGFFDGLAQFQGEEYPHWRYWQALVRECPRIGTRYLEIRSRRTA